MKGKVEDEELPNKYRVSWISATEEQRKVLCHRLGLEYTQVDDIKLLKVVAQRQQEEYSKVKKERQLLKTSLEQESMSKPKKIITRETTKKIPETEEIEN